MKRKLNPEIQANRGAHFLHLACQGGRRAPLLPVSYANGSSTSSKVLFMKERVTRIIIEHQD